MGQNPTESGPIVDESTVTRQCLEVAICDVYDYMTWDYPEATRQYELLEKIMQTLKDAYEALEVCELDNADNNRAWANNLLPQINTLNCGHAPTRCYTEMWEDGTIDVVAQCLKCSYSVGFPLSHFHHDGNHVHDDRNYSDKEIQQGIDFNTFPVGSPWEKAQYYAKIDEDDPTLAAREIATEHAFLILEDIPHGDPWESWSPDEGAWE